MGAVVLRCPNCGTAQPAPGECEACHEAAVRPFCTNHTTGRWLDGAVCDACGARLGDPDPRPAPPPRARREVPRATPPAARPVPPAPPRSSPPRAAPPRTTPPSSSTPPPRRPRREIPVDRSPAEPVREAPDVSGPFDLGDAPRRPRGRAGRFPIEIPGLPEFPGFPPARRRRTPAPDFDVRVDVPPAVRAGGRSVVGCLVRAVVTVVLLLALLAVGFLTLFGGGVRSWLVDAGQQTGVVEGVPAQTERGIAAYRAGDRATAERELGEAARAYPRSALAPLYLARLRLDAGDDYRARQQLAEAIRREPESALVRRTVTEYGCAIAARDPAGALDALAVVTRAGGRCPEGVGAPGGPDDDDGAP